MKYYLDGGIRLYNGDCLEVMDKLIERGVKVDLILTDPPYEVTQNKWDSIINLDVMWDKINKIKKSENTPIVLFCTQPFTSKLIVSNIKEFKYIKYWHKDRPSGFLNAKKQPLRDIEEIAVFYNKQCTYNPQMWKGTPLHGMGNKYKEGGNKNNSYGKYNSHKNPSAEREGDTSKYPRQLMTYSRPHPPVHPTQKPVELLEDLIRTYSNDGDLILDFTMGSGTTGVACKNLNRDFIGIELDEKYFDIAVKRIKGEFHSQEEEAKNDVK